MKKAIITAAVLLLANAVAVSAAEKVTRTFNVTAFDAISCNVPCEIKYETGEPKVVIYADDDVINNIKVDVENGQLSIKMPEKKLRNIKGAKIYITSQILNSLVFNGACEFENKRGIQTDKAFTLTGNGASDCEIASIRASDITVVINGVTDCEIDGISCKTLSAVINGAGSLDLEGVCDEADLTINGAGEIDIEKLSANFVNSTVRGAGSISRR